MTHTGTVTLTDGRSMEFGRVIGTVVATRKDPSLEGMRLVIVQPLDEHGAAISRPLIAVDTASAAGLGEHIFYVIGADAMMVAPESRPLLPVDAAIVGILHDVHIAAPMTKDGGSA